MCCFSSQSLYRGQFEKLPAGSFQVSPTSSIDIAQISSGINEITSARAPLFRSVGQESNKFNTCTFNNAQGSQYNHWHFKIIQVTFPTLDRLTQLLVDSWLPRRVIDPEATNIIPEHDLDALNLDQNEAKLRFRVIRCYAPNMPPQVIKKEYLGSNPEADISRCHEIHRWIRNPETLQSCARSASIFDRALYFYIPFGREVFSDDLIPISKYCYHAPQDKFNKSFIDMAAMMTRLNEEYYRKGVIIHWARRFTPADQDLFLIDSHTGNLVLCYLFEGTEFSKRPFVDAFNNCRQDLLRDPVIRPKAIIFRDWWNTQKNHTWEDMIWMDL